jgi:hypothetical protein
MVLSDPENTLPLEYPFEPPSWIPQYRDGIIAPILPEKGYLKPFTQPGLGFTIDQRMLRKYGKRFFKITESGLKWKVIKEKGLKTALEIKKRKEAAN